MKKHSDLFLLLKISILCLATWIGGVTETCLAIDYNQLGSAGGKFVKSDLVFDFENLQILDTPNGKIARIGVYFQIEKGWHIYWKNPGEAGKATEISWRLPESWKTSELKWPAPIRFIEKGGIKTYSYADRVLIYADLLIPPVVPNKDIELEFGAKVNFLVCSDRCIPGRAELSKKITLSLTAPETPSEHYPIFNEFEASVPETSSFSEISEKFGISSSFEKTGQNSGNLYLSFPSQISKANFFDLSVDQSTAKSEFAPSANGNMLKLSLENLKRDIDSISGLLIWEDAGKIKIFELSPVGIGTFAAADKTKFSALNFNENQSFTHSDSHPKTATTNNSNSVTSSTKSNSGLIFALFSAFIGGIILNFMPCVLPILSIKLFGLISAKEKSRRQNIYEGLLFTTGVLLSFISLASIFVALKLSGQSLGWGFQFQSPKFVFGMIVFLFFMALSFFDLFKISSLSIPGLDKLGSKQGSSEAAKSLIDGFLISLLSTPCTAPFLGTALAFAFSQSPLVLFSIFVLIALGLSFPYLIISTNPKLLKFFPQPGEWMNQLKHFMGFGLIATMIWLMHVLSKTLPDSPTHVAIILFCISIILWINGLKKAISAGGKLFYITMAFALIVSITVISNLNLFKSSRSVSTQSSDWLDFKSTDLTQISGPKLIDFTAEWCITCKYNENFILNDSSILELLKSKKVTMIKADWTSGDEQVSQALKKYGGDGVPLYVVIDQAGTSTSLGPILTKDLLRKEIEKL